MFSREDLECLDPGYFEIIYMGCDHHVPEYQTYVVYA